MKTKILFAGGGTAGHVEPALAVATWLQTNRPELQITFVGTKNGLENQLVPRAGFDLLHIPKVLMPRQVTPGIFLWPFKMLVATIESIKICRKHELVIGFGGYACPPIYIAAALLRKPIFIHEANAIPGWANRLGAPFATQIFIAFARAGLKVGRWRNAQLTGMPIRAEILAVSKTTPGESAKIRERQLEKWQLSKDKPTVLVFGGSQGSRHINEAILQSLSLFTDRGVQVVHSVGRNNALPTSTENYLPLSYIEDMSAAYQAADLVIARSGALTCAELAAVGKFAVLIPLPVGNGEQAANAIDLQTAGAAEVVDDNKFNADWLISNWDEIWRKARSFAPKDLHEISASAVIGKAIIDELEKQGG
jgi:UDP-N-acetylglucosamine--N-acetylmuramyl-(pentapeptide) pyrophosphoryl-undecaprenol N-acetylglucosamine transferase